METTKKNRKVQHYRKNKKLRLKNKSFLFINLFLHLFIMLLFTLLLISLKILMLQSPVETGKKIKIYTIS